MVEFTRYRYIEPDSLDRMGLHLFDKSAKCTAGPCDHLVIRQIHSWLNYGCKI